MQKSDVIYVLDSYAIITYFKQQPGWKEVESLLSEASVLGRNMLMSLINWGEIIYTRISIFGIEDVANTESILESFPIEIIAPDIAITRQAAIFKSLGGISYADCFAAALAKREKAILVTGDPEFKKLEKLGHIKIKWI